MEKDKTYKLKFGEDSEASDFGDVIVFTGINFLSETCTKCDKNKVYLCTNGYLYKSAIASTC